jgi:cobalamin biosynthetic protein CobC
MSSFSSLTVHGGRLDEAIRRFPAAPSPWIDLSTGINPLAYPIAAAATADQQALPSRVALARLEAAAAQAFGMATGAIAALPGSELGLRLLATIGLPQPIRVVRPCYRSHAEAFAAVERVEAADLDRLPPGGTVILANPNNPDGRLIAPSHLLALARRWGDDGGLLVVDEAFADAVGGASVLPFLAETDRVLVLRSFGKFFGLAGVRLGFACGRRDLVEALRHRLGDWPVSATAIALGSAAYADRGWGEATRRDLAPRAARLDALLGRHGYRAVGACPLFRLVDTPDAAALFERLGTAGILTRPFDYAPGWLRFGLPGDDAGFDRLDRALSHR